MIGRQLVCRLVHGKNTIEAPVRKLAILIAIAAGGWPAVVGMAAEADRTTPTPPLVLVAGASGKTGRLVLEAAVRSGFRVRGMARDPAKAKAEIPGRYEWVAGDVRDPVSLEPAMAGVDYVVCAIGATERSGPNGPEFVDYGGVKNLAESAKPAGVKQFVLVSSTGVGGGAGAYGWMLNTILMPGILEWKGKGEQALRASGLPYTILRPGGLTNDRGGQQGIRFTQGDTLGGGMIARADLATVAVAVLGNQAAVGKTLELAGDDRSSPGEWRTALGALKKD
jgi:uncharacterized protein YbjT (DUF2867 family)